MSTDNKHLPAYPQWIPVKDALPIIGEDVIVALEEETILKGCLKTNGWTAYFIDGQQLIGTRLVTHWMQMPVKPNESRSVVRDQSRINIAAMCLQGLLANSNQLLTERYFTNGSYLIVEEIARDAIKAAESLLTHLSNTEQ